MSQKKRTQHVTEIHSQLGIMPLYLLAGIPETPKRSGSEEAPAPKSAPRKEPPLRRASVERLLVLLHEFSAQYEEARRAGDEW